MSEQGADRPQFTLAFTAQPELNCHVLSFRGTAALNTLYAFEITALVRTADLRGKGPGDFFAGEASLGMRDLSRTAPRNAGAGPPQAFDAAWHGVATTFRKGARAGDWTIVELTLEPSLSRLRGQIQNRIHLSDSSCGIVKDSLIFGGLAPDAFSFALDQSAYPKREFVFQHGEDLSLFVLRTLEREGIALSFDQTGGRDVALFTDMNAQFPSLMDGDKELRADASDVSGMNPDAGASQIFGLKSVCRVPKASVRLKDYNWANPNRPLSVSLPVAPYGRGEIYLYGENFDTEAEGRRLAAIRRDEELCACEEWQAVSRIPGLMPGLALEVMGAEDPDADGRYVITATRIAGSQAAMVAAVQGVDLGFGAGEEDGLTHSLALSRLEIPWRPRRATPVPRISGQVTAWIDG
ncbi:MAG: phage late control D family protein, partial [Deltaproteobacteria bacterium]|nr:phage late control D family protein [Deltaproteobacteria bacterium]